MGVTARGTACYPFQLPFAPVTVIVTRPALGTWHPESRLSVTASSEYHRKISYNSTQQRLRPALRLDGLLPCYA